MSQQEEIEQALNKLVSLYYEKERLERLIKKANDEALELKIKYKLYGNP